MTLKKREKIMFLLTFVAVILAIVFSFGGGDVIDQVGQQSGELEAVEQQFVQSLQTLRDAPEINRRYQKIADQLPTGSTRSRADLQFSEELNSLCQRLGVPQPRLEPAVAEDIPGVEDYELITIRLRFEGPLDTIVKILKAFESTRLLFQEVDLRGALDVDTINTSIVVARIAAVPPEEIPIRQAQKARRVRRTSTPDEF
jgi:hypothetical protein